MGPVAPRYLAVIRLTSVNSIYIEKLLTNVT